MRQIVLVLTAIALSCLLTGCGGDREPVNEGKDRPVPKKEK
jgi:hypothetical protein